MRQPPLGSHKVSPLARVEMRFYTLDVLPRVDHALPHIAAALQSGVGTSLAHKVAGFFGLVGRGGAASRLGIECRFYGSAPTSAYGATRNYRVDRD